MPNIKGNMIAGISFIDEKTFNRLENFVSGSIKEGIFSLGILIGENGEYEMYAKNTFTKNNASNTDYITIYFDDKTPLETTFSNLVTFWKDAILKNKNADFPVFDSINLHFGNTVYYSKQNNE